MPLLLKLGLGQAFFGSNINISLSKALIYDHTMVTQDFMILSGTAEQYFEGGLTGGDSMTHLKNLNSIFLRRS